MCSKTRSMALALVSGFRISSPSKCENDSSRFRKLREKPILTDQDIVDRRAFAQHYGQKTASQWVAKPHAIIDNKNFKL